MVTGEWTGTMCLTEPQCGSDLNQVTTKAVPAGDGKYKITGTKIFISCGEHDMTNNIIHCVLARLPGAPEGTKGISLFLVPKHKVDDDGNISPEFNGVNIGRIEVCSSLHYIVHYNLICSFSIKWDAMDLPHVKSISKMLKDI